MCEYLDRLSVFGVHGDVWHASEQPVNGAVAAGDDEQRRHVAEHHRQADIDARHRVARDVVERAAAQHTEEG